MYIFCTIWKVPLVWWMDEYSGRWTVPFLFAKECSIAAKAADLLIYYNQRLDLVQVLWQLPALGVLSPSIGWIFWHWWLFCFDDCCCAAQTLHVPSHIGTAWLWKKTPLWCEEALVPADNRKAVIVLLSLPTRWVEEASLPVRFIFAGIVGWSHLLGISYTGKNMMSARCQIPVRLSIGRSSCEWNPVSPQVSGSSRIQVFLCELGSYFVSVPS